MSVNGREVYDIPNQVKQKIEQHDKILHFLSSSEG